MSDSSIGVAVIGAGMAGRAHINGYRAASTVFGSGLPEIRLVAVADAHEPFAADAAQRYGYQRAETGWEAVAAAPDIDAVSVVVANHLHRPIVEALLAAGKHVLCEKPVAPTVADAEAMAEAAGKSGRVAAVGFTFRRSPAVSAIREQITGGSLGKVMHFNGHYWCDYGFSKDAPMSWRYKGGLGSGALSDILIGLAIAYRPTTRYGLYAALLISIVYTIIGAILVPRLWVDPLGPMLKIAPVMVFNLMALAILEDR